MIALFYTLALVLNTESLEPARQHDDSLVAMASRHGGHVHLVVDACGGMSQTLPELAAVADLVLHGRLATERGRLSLDEQYVYTEYEVEPLRVLKGQNASRHPGRILADRVRMVLLGGSAEHQGLSFMMTINIVPHAERLRWGAEVVLFLTAHENEPGVYRVIGGAAGAFRVVHGQVVAMTREVAKARGDRPEALAQFLDRVQRLIVTPASAR